MHNDGECRSINQRAISSEWSFSASQQRPDTPTNSKTGMPHFPQEIINEILDYLAGSRKSSSFWRTCALVSRSFRPHSQTLLFRSITITTERPSLSRLHAVLGHNPHLGTHVRHLLLLIGPKSLSQIYEMLVETLTRLTGVTSCTWAEARVPFLWSIGETLRARLYQFLRLSSLEKADIYGADPVLIHFLASCEQLKSLVVNVPSAPSMLTPTTPTTLATGLLQELTIPRNCGMDLLHAFTSQSSRLCLSHLRKFTVATTYEFSEFEDRKASELEKEREACWQQVLGLSTDSLEELTFGKHPSSSLLFLFRHRAKRLLISLLLRQMVRHGKI